MKESERHKGEGRTEVEMVDEDKWWWEEKESESRRRKQKKEGERAGRQKMDNINVRMVERLKRKKKKEEVGNKFFPELGDKSISAGLISF